MSLTHHHHGLTVPACKASFNGQRAADSRQLQVTAAWPGAMPAQCYTAESCITGCPATDLPAAHWHHISPSTATWHLLYFFSDIGQTASPCSTVLSTPSFIISSARASGTALNAVVHYLPKVQAREGRHASSSLLLLPPSHHHHQRGMFPQPAPPPLSLKLGMIYHPPRSWVYCRPAEEGSSVLHQ